jgi:hypothetical protein
LITRPQDPEPDRLSDLLHELQVRRHPGPGVEVELDHVDLKTLAI